MAQSDDARWDEDNRYEKLNPDEVWDQDFANDLVGCSLFIGLTHASHDGEILRKEQIFGIVESVDIGAGINIRQTNGEIYTIAPVLDAIEAGGNECYQLTDADEFVENPDFVAWITAFAPLRS